MGRQGGVQGGVGGHGPALAGPAAGARTRPSRGCGARRGTTGACGRAAGARREPRRSARERGPPTGRTAGESARCGSEDPAGTTRHRRRRHGTGRRDAPGVGGGDGGGRVGHGAAERRHQAEPEGQDRQPPGQAGDRRGDQEQDAGGQAHHDDRPPEPRHVAGGAPEELERPHRGADHGCRADDPGRQVVPVPPAQGAAHAHEGGHRRCQGDRVVRVDHPARQAEHGAGHHQPPAPQEECGPDPVGPGGPPPDGHAGHQGHQRGGQQPRGLASHDVVEQTEDPGRPAEPAAGPGAAGQPLQPVVPEDQVDDAVRRRPVDGGPGRGRPQGHNRHPPAGGSHQRHPEQGQLAEAAAQARGRGQQVDPGEGGQDGEGLQHLGQEGDADQRAGGHDPPGAGAFEGADQRVGGGHQRQHHEGVRIVEPEHQRRHRRARQRGAGHQTRGCAEPPSDGGEHQADGGHTLEDLGHEHAPAREAEQPARELHDPQRRRGLVDGDEVGGVDRAEEERLPADGAGPHRRRVETVGVPRGAQVPQVGTGRGGQQRQQRRQHPSGPGRDGLVRTGLGGQWVEPVGGIPGHRRGRRGGWRRLQGRGHDVIVGSRPVGGLCPDWTAPGSQRRAPGPARSPPAVVPGPVRRYGRRRPAAAVGPTAGRAGGRP